MPSPRSPFGRLLGVWISRSGPGCEGIQVGSWVCRYPSSLLGVKVSRIYEGASVGVPPALCALSPFSLSLSLSRTLSLSHTRTHALAHTHTHTHALSLSLYLSLSLCASIPRPRKSRWRHSARAGPPRSFSCFSSLSRDPRNLSQGTKLTSFEIL